MRNTSDQGFDAVSYAMTPNAGTRSSNFTVLAFKSSLWQGTWAAGNFVLGAFVK